MQTNFETNFFLKTSTPGVCSWLLWVSSTEMYLLSSRLLYYSASPLQSLPTCVHTPLSEFWSCAQAHRSSLGTQACPPCPGCRCSAPLPSSCPSCILADAVFPASPEGPLSPQEILGGGCQGLGCMKGKKTLETKMPGNSVLRISRKISYFPNGRCCLIAV